MVRATKLDWTLVRPTPAGRRPRSGKYRVRTGTRAPGLNKIARADVAQFMTGALTDAGYLRQAPAICW